MGLSGEGEKAVYNTPQYQQLFQQFFPSPLAAVSPEQGNAEQDLMLQLLTQLQQRFAAPQPTLNLTPFQTQLNDITAQLTAPMSLAPLSQTDIDALDAIKANQDAQLAEQQRLLQGQLVSSLFGRGVQQSTIAGDAAAEFAEGRGRLNLQSAADDAARRDALRRFITQTQQGNLALAGQNVLGAGNLAVSGFTSQNDAIAQLINQMIATLGGQNQTMLGREGLKENQRQSERGLMENARQFNEQMEAQRKNWLTSLIGMGASLALAPVTGGTSLLGLGAGGIGSIFGRKPSGTITGAGSTWPQN
jgi:hypothetical protein